MINIGIFTDSSIYLNFCKGRDYLRPIKYRTLNDWNVGDIDAANLPDPEYLSYFDEVLSRVERIRPVIARHFDSEPLRDLLNRDITFQILGIMAALKKSKIEKVIFTTNSSHWLDSQMIEIGCTVLGIQQIFLYAIWLDGRILPMVQLDGIETRTRLDVAVSVKSFDENIKQIAELGFRNFFTSDWSLSSNKFLAFLKPIKFHWKRHIYNSLRRLKKRVPKEENFGGRKIGLLTELRVVANQISAIELLKTYLAEDLKSQHPINKKSIVIFAHYQPEATTFPEAGENWNHIDLIVKIRKENPNLLIYYKEHPDMFSFVDNNNSTRGGVARSRSYYKQLRALGVKFLDAAPPSDSSIPLTMNGTIGVERSLNGLPTIVAGYPWYQGLPGTYPLTILNNGGLSQISNTPDDMIREKAEKFLSEILNLRTITNVSGISGFHPKDNSEELLIHEGEFLNLIGCLLGTMN